MPSMRVVDFIFCVIVNRRVLLLLFVSEVVLNCTGWHGPLRAIAAGANVVHLWFTAWPQESLDAVRFLVLIFLLHCD